MRPNTSPSDQDVTALLRDRLRDVRLEPRQPTLRVRLGRLWRHRWVRNGLIACLLLGTLTAYLVLHGHIHFAAPSLHGTVLDLDGQPVADVEVRLEDEDAMVRTDDEGAFHFQDISTGTHRVVVETATGGAAVLVHIRAGRPTAAVTLYLYRPR